MKITKKILSLILILVLTGVLALTACTAAQPAKVSVVTTTTLLTYITEQVGGDLVAVTSIVPATQHPGDFDATPGDIQKLADAQLFLWHNWPGEVFVPGLIESAANAKLTVTAVEIPGNWMTPQVQRDAADKVAAALSQIDPPNSAAYQQSAAAYKERVSAKERELKLRLTTAKIEGTGVIGSFWQAGFLTWAGLNVVGTYMSPEALTPALSKELIDKAKEKGVHLIVDNLQNGKDAGKAIAEELDAHRVILSNFPGGFPGTDSWEVAITWNVNLIIDTLAHGH